MNVYANLKKLGLVLPPPPAKGGLYTPAKGFGGNLIYISGCGPNIDASLPPITGKLGRDFTVEQGAEYARNCMLNVLAVLERYLNGLNDAKDLNSVKSAVKLLCLVASADDFYAQPQVANGASGLLIDLYGEEAGTPTRSAIGVNVLPGNMPVEVEAIFEL